MTLSAKYEKARKYAYVLTSGKLDRDLIHDAYLNHFNRTGENIFDRDEWYLYKSIYYVWRRLYRKENTYSVSGEIRSRYFYSVGNGEHDISEENTFAPSTNINPLHILVEKDLDEKFKYAIKKSLDNPMVKNDVNKRLDTYNNVYELMKNCGERSTDSVHKDLDMSFQLYNYYKKEIRKTLNKTMSFNNPFAGSKLVVKKTLTELQWEKREDKEDFELYDYNETYNLYQHKLSKEGWLVKLKDHKINPYIKNLVDRGN